MKRIALVTVVLAAVGTGYATYPDEFMLYAVVAAKAGLRVWEAVEANPAPVLLAVGTFLLTIVYHKAKGKSLRESVEVAATRVTLVPVVRDGGEENAVVRRAKARATRAQLIADQIALQNRQRKLPAVVAQAEKETCYTEQALADAEKALADKRKAHDEAVAKLEALRKEQAEADAELAEIEVELKKLAEMV
jgi:hypothetical protein